MPIRLLALFSVALAASALPTLAAEITCDGPFAADSSEQRLIETYGKKNVVTGEVPGPEGSTVIATTVFPDDPQKKMEFGWWDEDTNQRVAYFTVPADATAPGGVVPGQTVKQVEALNGKPFTLSGFWWDYGGYADFTDGKLATAAGGCNVSVQFAPKEDLPADLNVDAISGEQTISSDEPLLEKVDAKVQNVTVGYPDYSSAED